MSERLVIDSDVLIDDLRDHESATEFLEGCSQPLALSAISVAELYVGVRDGEERSRLDDFIAAFETLPVDALIAVQAGL
ncbi:PIN domain-containing protein [Synechococcus sp. BA-132 BA5]|uniref:PIN domain-containing protein n=1 Tax=Synechococcus sp. BA-132 BA5 TaxID=3110252 RepID=UPI002B2174F3|nr:PIN domain-containing protein [Synechococcus sp. BA-132 BA5]MEA5415611.1 PIN domain-containing protein [Synechococcus sp. BA-132 BA5]